MVILFLASSLEPGQDGVGDYTRLLARECARQNHECLLIALNDPHVSAPVETRESEGGVEISLLRLPSRLSWQERVRLAVDYRSHHVINWTSLQFVSYGFDPRGLVRNLARHLAPIVAGSALHIMFHELWIGAHSGDPLKERIIGPLQRFYIRRMIERLRPRVVTTSNPYYRSLLGKMGLSASELPLFGNIFPIASEDAPCLPGILIRAGVCDERGAHPHSWIGLFFGTLHPEWKPEPFMSILIAAAKKAGKRARMISAGRLGSPGETTWKKLQSVYSPAVEFITLGEQSPRCLSALLLMADFGLAASPLYLIGKSGTAAAMLDHGLPVIVTRMDTAPSLTSSQPGDPLIHLCDNALESKLVAGLPKRPVRDHVKEVAQVFLDKLMKA